MAQVRSDDIAAQGERARKKIHFICSTTEIFIRRTIEDDIPGSFCGTHPQKACTRTTDPSLKKAASDAFWELHEDDIHAHGARTRTTDPSSKKAASNTFRELLSALQSTAMAIAITLVVVVLCRQFLSPNRLATDEIPEVPVSLAKGEIPAASGDQLANDEIPGVPVSFAKSKIRAASVEPDQHWERIKQDDLFVRAQRSTTTRSAITKYFCGAKVARNLVDGPGKKSNYFGVEPFSDFLACRHKKGQEAGTHRRSVYRLGIRCKDPLAGGYGHAFSIIAQPDGTFFWLQSSIGQYSLSQWMSKTDADKTPHAKLTFEQLQAKLQQLTSLMRTTSWTPQANRDYLDLFEVDQAGRKDKTNDWDPSHSCLDLFTWDEACEYPLPSTPATKSVKAEETVFFRSRMDGRIIAELSMSDLSDECVAQNVMAQREAQMCHFSEAELSKMEKNKKKIQQRNKWSKQGTNTSKAEEERMGTTQSATNHNTPKDKPSILLASLMWRRGFGATNVTKTI